MSGAAAHKVVFGSSKERTLFPLHYGSDRLGITQRREYAPHLGPGCYDNQEYGSILYRIQNTPQSTKGYVLSARTAARFPTLHKYGSILYKMQNTPQSTKGYGLSARTAARFATLSKTVTPSPQQYQKDQSNFAVPSPGKAPFNSTASRIQIQNDRNPGPGTYSQETVTNKKVSWPMCFGRPDWSTLPQPERQAVRVKITSEKEFIKQRNRVAYLSLYY